MTHLLERARTYMFTRAALAGALLLGAVALTGCGPAYECDGCGGPSPTPEPSSSCVADDAPDTVPAIVPGVSFGSGSFSALAGGELVEMQHGSQGGSHVDVSARTFVVAGSSLTVEFEIEGEWSGSTTVENKSCGSGEWAQVTGRVFDPPSGQVTLRVSILDGGAEIAMEEIPVYIQ